MLEKLLLAKLIPVLAIVIVVEDFVSIYQLQRVQHVDINQNLGDDEHEGEVDVVIEFAKPYEVLARNLSLLLKYLYEDEHQRLDEGGMNFAAKAESHLNNLLHRLVLAKAAFDVVPQVELDVLVLGVLLLISFEELILRVVGAEPLLHLLNDLRDVL